MSTCATVRKLDSLIKVAKDGGRRMLKGAVEYRLGRMRDEDPGGLFQWVDASSSTGFFVIVMCHDAVDMVRQYGSEIFIDRWVLPRIPLQCLPWGS